MAEWTNKVAVICGGSSGLGLDVARALVRQHCSLLVIVGRDHAKLDSAKAGLVSLAAQTSSPTRIETLSADLSSRAEAQDCAEKLKAQSPHIHLLVQAIGVSDRGTVAELTGQRVIELIQANVVTSLHALQVFFPSLVQSRGVVVLVGSLASLFAPRFLGGYSIAKHALAALAQQARLEFAEKQVHVMLCCPGPIRRSDGGTRYQDRATDSIPAQALQPAGGAKVNQLDPEQLSMKLLSYAAARRPILITPSRGRLLRLLTAISQRLGDFILRRKSA